jgi:hypothetical protein
MSYLVATIEVQDKTGSEDGAGKKGLERWAGC